VTLLQLLSKYDVLLRVGRPYQYPYTLSFIHDCYHFVIRHPARTSVLGSVGITVNVMVSATIEICALFISPGAVRTSSLQMHGKVVAKPSFLRVSHIQQRMELGSRQTLFEPDC
jgi:hypothetical protein